MSLLSHLRRRGYTIWRTGAKSFELVPEPPESLMAKVKARGKNILAEIEAEEFAAEQKIARLQHQVRSGRMEPAEAEELMTYLARQTTAATAPSESEACATCGVTKPLEAFHRQHDMPDGRTARCKDCRTERERARVAARRSVKPKRLPPPPTEELTDHEQHSFIGKVIVTAKGEREMECRRCGCVLYIRPDGTRYGDALEHTCAEAQELYGYTPAKRRWDARQAVEDLHYAHMADAAWPEEHAAYHEASTGIDPRLRQRGVM